jgi:hypothetical protein
LAALAAAGSWFFFDQTKHNQMLSAHAGFLDDPYDAVGSFGIQIGAFAAFVALVWLVVERRTHKAGWQHRGVTVAAITFIAIGISDLTGQTLNIGLASAGPWIAAGIILLLTFGVGLLVLNPRPRGQLPSLLAVLGAAAPFGGKFLTWADRHPVVTSVGVGLSSGVALAIAHQMLEGGPSDAVSLVLLSAFFVLGEGTVVAASWFFIGKRLMIYSARRTPDRH